MAAHISSVYVNGNYYLRIMFIVFMIERREKKLSIVKLSNN